MPIHFSSQLNFKEYLLATLVLILDSWWKITLYLLLILFTFFNLHIFLYKIIFAGCVVGIPSMVFFLAWQNFRKNPLIGEELRFEIDESTLVIQGKSFEVKRGWNELYRVSETTRFCFFWITKRLAVPVLKSAISNTQKHEIRKYLLAFPSVKNDLSAAENS